MDDKRPTIPQRGTPQQPANRFTELSLEPDAELEEAEARERAASGRDAGPPRPRTLFLRDRSRSVISRTDSPDVRFRASLNPYRGCEHGCIYCFARPTHEYLGFSSGLDFETRILVKEAAPELLERELRSTRYTPEVLALSGVTDPYQPIEARLEITRRCLEVLARAGNPVSIITKNALVLRDRDHLASLAERQAAVVWMSVTTLDEKLWKVLEPRTSRPGRRLEAIRALTDAGIPVGVLIAPVLPGLTDHEIPALVEAVAEAGARAAGPIVLRLPHGLAPLFEDWLERHLPERKDKVLSRIRSLRGGKLNDSTFGRRMRGEGPFAELIAKLFEQAARRAGLAQSIELSTAAFERPRLGPRQLDFFDSQ